MIVKQDNREFIKIVSPTEIEVYYVVSIDGKNTNGREGSYIWRKCDNCGRIIGTQFNGFSRHQKACYKDK